MSDMVSLYSHSLVEATFYLNRIFSPSFMTGILDLMTSNCRERSY